MEIVFPISTDLVVTKYGGEEYTLNLEAGEPLKVIASGESPRHLTDGAELMDLSLEDFQTAYNVPKNFVVLDK